MANSEITRVQVIIREFLYETKEIVKDPNKSQEWLVSFRETLEYQDLQENPNVFALKLLQEAEYFCNEQKRKAQIGQVKRILEKEGVKNPSKEMIESKRLELYGFENSKNFGSAKPVTDAPNGNAGENCCNGGATSAPVNLESANIRDEKITVTTNDRDGVGDAPHRKEGEECPMRGSVAISSQQLNSGTSSAPSTLSELANNVKNGEPKKMAFGIAKVIMLTAEEALKLKELYKEDLPIAAQILENYIVNNSRKASKYKSHYMVMRQGGWVWQRVQEYKTQQARTATAEKNLESAKNRANYKPFEVRQREMIEGVMATLEDPPENLINFRAG